MDTYYKRFPKDLTLKHKLITFWSVLQRTISVKEQAALRLTCSISSEVRGGGKIKTGEEERKS